MRATSSLLAVALAIADIASAQNYTNATEIALEAELANLEHFWSYGRSPPVYPSRMFHLLNLP
jgi:beta-glucosidase